MTASALSDRLLKIATDELIHSCGGQVTASQHCRVKNKALSKYASLNEDGEGAFMPVDVVRCLERLSGVPIVTRHLAREAGFELVAVPTGRVPATHWPQHLAAVSKESGDVVQGLATAIGDGRVCARDVRQHDMINQALELAALAVSLAEQFRRIVEDEE